MPKCNIVPLPIPDEVIDEFTKYINELEFDENRRHESQTSLFRLMRKTISKCCSHSSLVYVPDPSGNNDSYHRCDICGKET